MPQKRQSQYQIGQEVVPGYTLVRPLGSGMAGDVWVARAAGGMAVALKIVRSLSMLGGRKELQALKTIRNIRHPNLCPVHGFWTKDTDGRLLEDGESDAMMPDSDAEREYITKLPPAAGTMDIDRPADSGKPAKDSARSHPEQLIVVMGLGDCTLHDRLREVRRQAGLTSKDKRVACGLEAEETIHYLRPAADAIDELNQQHNIYHCDIKPQNILIVGGGAQVCDFGLANRIEGDSRTTHHPFATPAYAAPEVLDGMTYSRGVDQYSLAVTYFELRTGQLPFDISSAAKILQAKCSGKLDLTCVSSAERKVLQKAMHVVPAQRYATCTEFINDLAVASGVDRRGGITAPRLCALGLALIMFATMVVLALQRFARRPGPIEVAVTTDPHDAAIMESGEMLKTSADKDGHRPLGSRSRRVAANGHEPESTDMDIELVPLEFPIVIKTDPPNAQLTWNGTTLQRAEDNTVRLPLGTHQIHAEREGFKSETKTIVVADEDNQPALFKLARLANSDRMDLREIDDMQEDEQLLLKKDEARFIWLFARYGVRGPATAEISERQLTQALALDPNLGQAYRDRAIARTTLGKNAIAKQDFEEALKQMGENFHLRQEYAKLLARMSAAADQPNRDEIVENCKQQCAAALEIRQHATGPRLLRAEFLFRQKKNADAKNEAETLKENSIDPEQRSYAWNLLGLIALREGNPSDAFANLKSAIAADPENAEAHLNLGKTSRDFGVGAQQAERIELLQQALNHYTLAMQIKPHLRQQVLPLIAQVQEDMGMFEAAIGTYTSLIEVFGPTAERYTKRASLYDRIGNAAEATKNRARALDLEYRQE